jgi:hypothetical protein
LSDDKKFTASFVSIASVFEDIGAYAVETIDALDGIKKNQLYQKCHVNLIVGIAIMVAEQDSMKDTANEILSILPHILLILHGKDVSEVLRKKRASVKKMD